MAPARLPSLSGLRPQIVAFAVALPLVMAGSCITADIAFGVYDTVPEERLSRWWWGDVLNRYAPGIGGLLVTMVLYTILRRKGWYTIALRAHFLRAASWYVIIALILWLGHANRGNSDWGLMSQIVEWPLAGLLAGCGFDLLVTAFAPFIPALRPATEQGQ